jgi:hypothetical protein
LLKLDGLTHKIKIKNHGLNCNLNTCKLINNKLRSRLDYWPALRWDESKIIFFNVKKYLDVANVLSSRKKLNSVRIDLIWLGDFDGSRNNLNAQ